MRVLFVSAEVHPFSKTGGLADVAGALPAALAARGHEVLVVTPWYRRLGGGDAPLWIGDVDAPFDDGFERVGVGTLERDGVRYAFVGHGAFHRDRLYGYEDDLERFALFVRAAPQVAERVGFRPDVAHVHDWHAALLPMVLREGWHLPEGFPGLPSMMTIHNVQYQGEGDVATVLHRLRLPAALSGSWLDHFGRANALQAGCGFADVVTTVSPTYADEIRRPEYGYGLDGTFRHLGPRLIGILNGLDGRAWDPATDAALPARYDAADRAGKAVCKDALCAELHLDPSRPLLGVVSRLAEQKGIDVLLDAADALIDRGWSLALLGSGDAALEARAADLAARRPEAAAVIGFSDDLARRIYAGADAFAVPSRFEPCGLTQMIAMRYGTLPIARETGGLVDTIEHGVDGWLFRDLDAGAILWAADRAAEAIGTPAGERMRDAAMARDFSWDASARRYEDAYRAILAG